LLLYSFGGGVFILFLGNWYFHLLLLLFGYTHTHTCCSWNEQLNASGGRAIVVFICERNWHVYNPLIILFSIYSRERREERGKHERNV
jgi:hypothetical protein